MNAYSFWSDSFSFPLYIASASIVVLLSHLLWESEPGLKLRARYFKALSTQPEHAEAHGGTTIFAYNDARLLGCLVLLSLSLVSVALDDDKKETGAFTHQWILLAKSRASHILLCITYFYASVLAVVSVGSVNWRNVAVKHLNALLLCTFGVYFYRDIFPLATFSLLPQDLEEGRLLWAKILVLFAVSVVFPVAVPRQYTPVDPKHPSPVPNPEQNASLFSLVLYFFLDPIIFLGYSVPHLKFDQASAFGRLRLCRESQAESLAGRLNYAMAITLSILALSAFISPIGINRLLSHLENPNQESLMKPWFWIILLFLGPIVSSVSYQWYIFISTHMATHISAIITQLVFEHALRMRVKSETGEKKKNAAASGKEASANLLGKITNLVTSDLNHGRNLLFLVILVPIQIVGAIVFLYQVLGWSAFVGMAVMILLFPLPGYVAKLQQGAQKATLKKTDTRVQTVVEMHVSGQCGYPYLYVRMFGWEKEMNTRIADKREEELKKLWIRRLLDMTSGMLNYAIPMVVMLTVIAHQDLSASKVFSSMGVFDLLRNQLWYAFSCISTAVNGKVSLDRLDDFLHNTKLLDTFTSKEDLEITAPNEPASNLIGFRDATFAWSSDEADGTLTPSSRRFQLKIEGKLLFKPGCINLVLGPTGSSYIHFLSGEMHLVSSTLSSWYNLPRDKGISYAAQESWVLNDTIRNNILFNSPIDEARYNKVLYQCCLERDLELWDAGDETEVGEKGLTLSGGQKARVTLARAIYANTEIILMDDVLAALDVHTARWIVDKCLSGDLIKNRTVILVTHNVVMTSKIAEFVVSLGLDGRVHSQGSVSDALEQDEQLAEEVTKDQEILELAEKELDPITALDNPPKKDGKLVIPEEIAIGHVSWKALGLYFKGMGGGGAYTIPFFVIMLSATGAAQALDATQTWYLGYWASGLPIPSSKASNNRTFRYLGGYSLLLLTSLTLFVLSYIYFTSGSFRASRIIHKQLVESIMGTTLRWLDFTPISRITARCTVDISAIDTQIAQTLRLLIGCTVSMFVKFFAVVLFTPLSVKREQSNAKAPVLAHFGATMAGLISVRAYGAQEAAASLAYYIVYFQSERPFNIGFSLNMALGFAELILCWVRIFNQFEVQGNSLERIESYLNIEQEPKPTPAGIPPAYWPASGNLSVDSLSAKYSQDGPTVLHDISFTIKSGERVGVVGRTGSGKSSLTLSLLRCILTDGTVYYDGLPTHSINLDALRSNITIIPQVPELLVGSLRSNLDMFGQFDDLTLNNALRSAGLSSLQADMDEGKLTLDSEISAGGTNLSVGQRQIIALARAIIRGSKLMILDEDYKTDTVIQSSLRTELPSDTTCVIVAHRLQTIMDADKIAEFGSPKVLLENKRGLLRALVDESGDKDALYEMAGA
ncbi:P-loop containing nucleoside triphosphate hydrolase protein [Mycena olivaceomarginata]|nr:P-loop containing nucleoside triphosphate hydrolase protein [Mycena olivaceomarginata]